MRCNLFIVDDEPLVREGIRNFVDWELYGFHIVGEASDGECALSFIENCIPDLILCDIIMPHLNGLELLRIIKTKYPTICVIMLTSYDEFNYIKMALQLGASDYILKPTLSPDTLIPLLQHNLPHFTFQTCPSSFADRDTHISKLMEGILPPTGFFLYDKFILLCYSSKNLKPFIWLETENTIKNTLKTLSYDYIHSDNKCIYIICDMYNKLENHSQLSDLLPTVLCYIPICIIDRIDGVSNLMEVCSHLDFVNSYDFYNPQTPNFIGSFYTIFPLNEKYFNLNHFINLLEIPNRELAFSLLNDYIMQIDFTYGISAYELKILLETALYHFICSLNITEEYANHINDLKTKYLSQITAATNIYIVREIFNAFCGYIKKNLGLLTVSDHIMYAIENYVLNNYYKNINLQSVAKYLDLSYSYVSSYFNMHHSQNFKEYLNNIRIDKAKSLLLHSSLSVSDIAFKVGYSDHAYFTKVFKRSTGYPPSIYKQVMHDSFETKR